MSNNKSLAEIEFKDQNFYNALVTELERQNLPRTEEGASKLLSLNISAKNIVNLEGIEICDNLRFLAASQNKIQSIQPLQALENLVTVSIWGNEISDLSLLEVNPNLQKIYAFDNPLQIFPSKQLISLMGTFDFTGIKTTDLSEKYFDDDQSIEQRHLDGIAWENIKKKNNEKQAERQRIEAEQVAEAERQRIEAEQAAEAERQRIEAEQAAEAERQRIEAEQAAEAERQRIEAEQAAEAERQRIEAEQAAEAERQRIEAEQAAEAERQRIEAEQAAEAERQRIEAEQAAEAERQRIEAEQAAEAERQRIEAEQAAEAERQRIEAEQAAEAERQRIEDEKYKSVEHIQSENILTFDMIEHFAPQGPTKQLVIGNEQTIEKKVEFREHIATEKATEINSLNNSVISKKSDIMQLAINANTAEKQMLVLRHELLTAEALEVLLNHKPETYILKLIFANSNSDAVIKQKVLQLENPQQIFNLYAKHTLKKEIENVTESWTLEQYAKIAFDSESQLAVLNNSQVNSMCIQSILAINPEIYILKIIATHEKTPEAERTKVLENLQLEKSEVQQHVQNDEQFFKLLSDVSTSDQLEKYAFLATTPEMQLAILRHPKISAVTLEIMSDLVTELPILKLILTHMQANNQIIERILQKLSEEQCEQVFRLLSGSEFEKLVALVESGQELAFFTRFANTAIKQLSVVRNKYIDQQNLEMLQNLSPEPYIQQQIDKTIYKVENMNNNQTKEEYSQYCVLPQSKTINFDALNNIFDKYTNSYKFLLFKAILELSNKKNKDVELDYDDVFVEMLVYSWVPIIKLKLDFGVQDGMKNIITSLIQEYKIMEDSSLLDVKEIFSNNKVEIYKKYNQRVFKYVIYRMLTSFFEESLRGLPDSKKNGRIATLSQHVDSLYVIDDKNKKLRLNGNYQLYLNENRESIEAWYNFKFETFLETKNSNAIESIKRLKEYVTQSQNEKETTYNSNKLTFEQNETVENVNDTEKILTPSQKMRKIQFAKTSAELKPFLEENNLTLNIAIAKHQAADGTILKHLIDLRNPQLTTYVRKNRNMTAELRQYLYNLEQAVHNDNNTLSQIPKKTKRQEILKTIDYHQKIRLASANDVESQGYFADLAHESRNEVRQALIDNPVTPKEIIVYLTNDRIYSIAESAKKRLQNLSLEEKTIEKSSKQAPMNSFTDKENQVSEIIFDFGDDSYETIDLIDIDEL